MRLLKRKIKKKMTRKFSLSVVTNFGLLGLDFDTLIYRVGSPKNSHAFFTTYF